MRPSLPPAATVRARANCRAAAFTLVLAVAGAPVVEAGPLPDAIFASGFETGDVGEWSSATGVGGGCGPALYSEAFDNAGSWPAGWTAVGGVDTAEVAAGRARLRPSPSGYSLARTVHPVSTADVEVRFTVSFEDIATQGVGFYVRQNGGYLHDTTPTGEGYAVFVEGFRQSQGGEQGIGVWREVDGAEQPVEILFDDSLGFTDVTDYRVRFRVHQLDAATTLLQAKVWPLGDSEPFGWQVQAEDSTPSLQNVVGGIAVDSWSSIQSPGPITAFTAVDDIEIVPLCDPRIGLSAPAVISEGFAFTEGPLWRGDHLLFTDLGSSTIERLDPPTSFSTFRSPANEANGLTLAVNGDLLAAERNPPRISVDDGVSVATLVDQFMGDSFNAPNDLVVRADGVLFFTDPTYGMVGAPEIGFNGLYRLMPDSTLIAEWQGATDVNEPNGVVLSADQSTLFVTDSHAGELLAWSVAPADGALTFLGPVATGLAIPDGMCIDPDGNLWVATWADDPPGRLEVFTADGAYWGAVSVPRAATNCAFGGDDGRTLYVTAQVGLYRAELP